MWRLSTGLPRLILGMAAMAAMMSCSGGSEWRSIRNVDDTARYWMSPDGMRLLVVDRTSNKACYFDNTPGRLWYTYSVAGLRGEWAPVPGYDGLFSVGSGIRVGVVVNHRDELPGPVGRPILDRAAAFLEQLCREAFGPLSVTVRPYPSAKFKAIRFDAIYEVTVEGQSAHARTTKILAEYSPEWVIQVSVLGREEDSVIVDQVLNSFRTSNASNRLWPEVSRILADIGGFSVLPAGARVR